MVLWGKSYQKVFFLGGQYFTRELLRIYFFGNYLGGNAENKQKLGILIMGMNFDPLLNHFFCFSYFWDVRYARCHSTEALVLPDFRSQLTTAFGTELLVLHYTATCIDDLVEHIRKKLDIFDNPLT